MRYLIVDALNLFIRNFTVVPVMDNNGDHAGGLTGFLMGLNKLVRDHIPDRVIIAWDGEGGSWKRRSIYKDYKAGRKPKLNRQFGFETPEESFAGMKRQLSALDEYLKNLPVTEIRVKGLEADDVIAYMVNNLIDKTDYKLIVSSDKDFYQLIDDSTDVYAPTKKKMITPDVLIEETGVLPENFIFVKALVGDGSDNIKGLRGIGTKTVPKLFPFLAKKKATEEMVFEHAELNKKEKAKYRLVLENRDLVRENVKLMQLADPFMSPLSAKSIREQFSRIGTEFAPTKIRMNLVRQGLQLKARDFFSVFKDLGFRTLAATGGKE